MTSSSWDRSRRHGAAAIVLTALALGVLILAVGVGVPQAWWPHTGRAFAADARHAGQDPCALIVGPAKAYCERGTTTPTSSSAASDKPDTGAAWRLVPAGAGLAAFVMWRLRSPVGQRRS